MKKAQMIVEIPDDVFDEAIVKRLKREVKSMVDRVFAELVKQEVEISVNRLKDSRSVGYTIREEANKQVAKMLAEQGLKNAIDEAIANYEMLLKQRMEIITKDMISKVSGRLEEGITVGIANAMKRALKGEI